MRHLSSRVPLTRMEIGDSVFVPEFIGDYDMGERTRRRCDYYRVTQDKRFARRRRVERGVEGYRIWRVK